ncbi:MAG: hypothetical protein GF409_06650 [Candidatus Omnitrophica bacterium]|nr:hypothetical protein [Candidatus Omnitrophota bacterium]
MMYNISCWHGSKMAKHLSQKAFTLVELAIVLAVIMALIAVALPAYFRSTETAKRKLCLNQQKTLFEVAALYEVAEQRSLEGAGSQKGRLEELASGGYIKADAVFECPCSPAPGEDDYRMVFEEGAIADVDCTIRPEKHRWP